MGKKRKEDEEWVQVRFWGGSKDGECGLFRDVDLETGDDIRLDQKIGDAVVGVEIYVAGPTMDFYGEIQERQAKFKGFEPCRNGQK